MHTSMLFSLFCGIFLVFAGQIIARPLLMLMASPPDVIDLAALYLRIYFAGMPFLLVYNMGASLLRSRGDSARPLYSLLFAGAVNVLLNLFFVIVCRMSVAGVALATVISNGLSACLVLSFLMREEGPFRLELRKLRFHRTELLEILRIGLPSGLQGTVFSVSNVCIQTAINGFGSAVIAGSAVALNFEYISYFGLNGFIQACLTFTGQNYGAGEKERCRKVWRISMTAGILRVLRFPHSLDLDRVPRLPGAPGAFLRLSGLLDPDRAAGDRGLSQGESALPLRENAPRGCAAQVFQSFCSKAPLP